MDDAILLGNPQFGLLSGLWGDMLNKLLGSVSFDWKKLNPVHLKAAVAAFVNGWKNANLETALAVKPATNAPGGLDDIAIDKAIALENQGLDALLAFANAEIDKILGAAPVSFAEPPATAAEANTYLAGFQNVPQANRETILAHPELVPFLKHIFNERKQAKIMASPEWLQKVLDFLVKYGPTIAQVMLTLLTLFL